MNEYENYPKNSRIEPRNLTLVGGLLSNSLCPLAVPSPLPSDGRGEGQGEVRVHGEGATLDFRGTWGGQINYLLISPTANGKEINNPPRPPPISPFAPFLYISLNLSLS